MSNSAQPRGSATASVRIATRSISKRRWTADYRRCALLRRPTAAARAAGPQHLDALDRQKRCGTRDGEGDGDGLAALQATDVNAHHVPRGHADALVERLRAKRPGADTGARRQ